MAEYVSGAEASETPAEAGKLYVEPARAALVKRWCERVKADKKHFEDPFKKIRKNMKLAAEGTDNESWIANDSYVVPIVNRHINQAVSTLYARNPKAVAKRKPKLMYQIWDGDPASLQAAMSAAIPPTDPMTGQLLVDQNTGLPPEPDPNAIALLQEVQAVKQQLLMYDRLAKTMQLLFAHYMDEQDCGYKEHIKAMVRRAKVCGVGYVKLGFQRRMGRNPDIEAQIADTSNQLAVIERLVAQAAEGQVEPESAKAEELRLLMADLQQKVEIILREGPVLSFPRATEIIPDKKCRHLKTFSGARWVTHEFHMDCDEVLETYKIDLKKGGFTAYTPDGEKKVEAGPSDNLACVWVIEDKKNGQMLTVCDGYPDFLKEPAEPDVKIERFWTIFPLVMNEIESEDQIYPPSDVWNTRHMQREYNSSREGLREHRIASRPRYATAKGKLEEVDKEKLSSSPAHSVIEVNALLQGEDITKVIQRVPAEPVDPTLYETESTFADVQRTVGSQEANLGGISGATATETSIAENSRMTASADNTDDLDTLLTNLARAMGQLMLQELNIETVREIAGPGAVWPELPPKREEIVKDLILDVEAGSSGRPNQAAELANFERAAPTIVQLPGINPIPIAKRYLDLLGIDVEDAIVEGLPSIVSMNQTAGRTQGAGGDPSKDPNQQGDKGSDNAPKPGQNEQGAQPAFPAPASGQTVASSSI